MSLIQKENLKALKHEYNLIRLLYHRNKNQHRASVWWKHFNALKRSLTKLIPLLEASITSKKFQKEANTLVLARHLKFVIVKRCYREFNGIIALGQFITLGMTLVGLLSKVNHEIGTISGINDRKEVRLNIKEDNENIMQVDDDLGEEIGEIIKPAVKSKVKKTDKNPEKYAKHSIDVDDIFNPKKKAKSKKKKTIDDIFGENKKVSKKTSELNQNENSLKVDKKGGGEKKKKKSKRSAIDDIFGGV